MNMDGLLARSLKFCFGTVNGLSYSAKRVLWQRMNQTLVAANKHRIFEYANYQISKGQPVDYLEFGVGSGGTFRFWLGLNRCHESRFYGFDTFTGLPEGWERFGKYAFSTEGIKPEINDMRGGFVVGLFQDTLPAFQRTFERRNRLVLNIDCDLYTGAMFVLTHMNPFIRSGDLIYFDEFNSPLNEFRAYDDYSKCCRRTLAPIVKTRSGNQILFEVKS
jgi:hypothetical protein